jgi:protein-disulfide isomerase
MGMQKYSFDNTRDHYQGSVFAPIEIVQYGDFQCVHCAQAYPDIKLLIETLGGRIRFVYRHYPLPNIHSLALEAAVASEAAASQGKFWPMHDMIFKNQKYLLRSSFSGFAEEIGLNMEQYENSMKYKRLKHKVINDFESGVKCGVDGTPTFFISGRKYNGYNDFEGLYKACKYTFSIHDLSHGKNQFIKSLL